MRDLIQIGGPGYRFTYPGYARQRKSGVATIMGLTHASDSLHIFRRGL
jgi:hypothetical protein